MKYPRAFLSLAAVLTLFVVGQSVAQENPVDRHLIPPELLLVHAEELGIGAELQSAIRSEGHEMQSKAAPYHEKRKAAMEGLGAALEADDSDEKETLAELDAVLDAEREIKRVHLGALVRIRAKLSSEQRQKALQLKQKFAMQQQQPGGRQQRLQSKLEQVKRGIESRMQSGDPPHEVVELMQRFPELMKDGKSDEAEALLGRAIKMLTEGSPNGGTDKPKKPEADTGASRLPTPSEFDIASAEAVRAEYDALSVEEVEWRKIDWRTCLIDGLNASKKQSKPVLLWVFIDRPVDDKRC